jgi:hypothetical protein
LGGDFTCLVANSIITMPYGTLRVRLDRRCAHLPHEQRDQNNDRNGHAKEQQE